VCSNTGHRHPGVIALAKATGKTLYTPHTRFRLCPTRAAMVELAES